MDDLRSMLRGMAGNESAPRILVAEDDPDFGYMLERWLVRRGYACTRVRDAAAAVLALEATPFDLVISDIDMPGNKGLALVKHIGAHGGDLPIILLTGKPSFETAVDAVGSSVAAYLVKPPDHEALARQIQDLLDRRARERARAAEERRWQDGIAVLAACEQRLLAGETEGAVRPELLAALRSLAGGPPGRLQVLEAAIRETIAVLEDTRKAFKSRQLADLRRRLEEIA